MKRTDELVPHGFRLAGAWAWRFVAIAAAIAIAIWLGNQVSLVILPLFAAALLTSLLHPVYAALVKARVPNGVSVALVMLALLAVIVGLFWIAGSQLRDGYPELQDRAVDFWDSTRVWLLNSPLQVSQDDLNAFGQEVLAAIRKDAQAWVSSALSVGTTAGHLLTGGLLTLFTTLFFIMDGERIWEWIKGFFPERSRATVDRSAKSGWATVGNFMRVQVLVAAIDALGIGIGAAILGLPMVLPVAILVFLGSFIPVVGAVLTGALAVFIALVTLGPIKALIMLAIVFAVQQLEGHVLQPLIMGNAVKIHPLGVVLAVAAGSIVAGIPGALFAVPLAAFINVFVHTVAGESSVDGDADREPGNDASSDGEADDSDTGPNAEQPDGEATDPAASTRAERPRIEPVDSDADEHPDKPSDKDPKRR